MYVITVYFKIHEEHLSNFMESMKQQAKDSLTHEANCFYFDICQSESDPTSIFLYEIYNTEQDFKDHLASEHFINFNQKTATWIADKKVVPYNKIKTSQLNPMAFA